MSNKNNHENSTVVKKSDEARENKTQQALHITLASHDDTGETGQVLLATAEIYILDAKKQPVKCRALLDSASQSNFLTTELFNRLNLEVIRINTSVTGINQTKCNISHKTKARIESRNHSYKAYLEFLVLNKITSNLPQVSVNISLVKFQRISRWPILNSTFWKMLMFYSELKYFLNFLMHRK